MGTEAIPEDQCQRGQDHADERSDGDGPGEIGDTPSQRLHPAALFFGVPGSIGAGLCCIFEWTLAARFHKLVVVTEVADERQVFFS